MLPSSGRKICRLVCSLDGVFFSRAPHLSAAYLIRWLASIPAGSLVIGGLSLAPAAATSHSNRIECHRIDAHGFVSRLFKSLSDSGWPIPPAPFDRCQGACHPQIDLIGPRVASTIKEHEKRQLLSPSFLHLIRAKRSAAGRERAECACHPAGRNAPPSKTPSMDRGDDNEHVICSQ